RRASSPRPSGAPPSAWDGAATGPRWPMVARGRSMRWAGRRDSRACGARSATRSRPSGASRATTPWSRWPGPRGWPSPAGPRPTTRSTPPPTAPASSSPLPGSGAAGGLAGGLAALGARLEPGFDVVADALSLPERIEGADLVVTGEGLLDRHSFAGKAVGGVVGLARRAAVPVLVVAGDVETDEVPAGALDDVELISLVERFGDERARSDVLG